MKIPKFTSGKVPDKKRLVRIAFRLTLISFFFASIFVFPKLNSADQSWPYGVIDSAQTVTLSQANAILKQDAQGRRAAVVGTQLVIEVEAGAGNDPERLMRAFATEQLARMDANKAVADALAQADKVVGEDQEADEQNQPYKVVDETVVLDVIKTKFPSSYTGFVDDLVANSGFNFSVHPEVRKKSAGEIVNSIIPILLIIAIFAILIQMFSGRSSMGTTSSYEVINHKDLTIGLDDVAGIGIAKADIEEIIELLKNPGDAAELGARLPRGALFDGPPGTGKTLLAKALAKEAGVSFISIDASSLSALFVGMGAIKVRGIFKKARKMAPCIVFIDEIDAAGGRRNTGSDSGSNEKANTLNAILTELDGFDDRTGIFVVGATNRADTLDPALMRPGRMDRRITMTNPDIAGREEILIVKCKDKPLAADVDLKAIAGSTYGMSGAQLENLVNEAALSAKRAGQKEITQFDLGVGRDRILLPRSSSQILLAMDDRHLTAVHEAGHAMLAIECKYADPIEKVTILPQGNALGYVMQAPDRDFVFYSKARLIDRIRVAVAGRAAELVVLGEDMVTTGAASDIRQATAVARAMVTQYGMSPAGFVEIDTRDPALCETNGRILELITDIIWTQQKFVQNLLEEKRDVLDALTDELLAKETMSGAEVAAIVRRHRLSAVV